jgi:hypothetical protein
MYEQTKAKHASRTRRIYYLKECGGGEVFLSPWLLSPSRGGATHLDKGRFISASYLEVDGRGSVSTEPVPFMYSFSVNPR